MYSMGHCLLNGNKEEHVTGNSHTSSRTQSTLCLPSSPAGCAEWIGTLRETERTACYQFSIPTFPSFSNASNSSNPSFGFPYTIPQIMYSIVSDFRYRSANWSVLNIDRKAFTDASFFRNYWSSSTRIQTDATNS